MTIYLLLGKRTREKRKKGPALVTQRRKMSS